MITCEELYNIVNNKNIKIFDYNNIKNKTQ